MQKNKIDKKKAGRLVLDSSLILIISFMWSASLSIFILPNNFIPGGVSGIASIIQSLTGISAGLIIPICNAPLLIIAFLKIGKKFSIKTLAVTLISSFFLYLLPKIGFFEYTVTNGGDKFLSAFAGGLLCGAGLGIMFKIGTCYGGSDIVGMLIQKKYPNFSVAWILFMINIIVVAVGGVLYGTVGGMDLTSTISSMLFSLIVQFLTSFACQSVLNGFRAAYKFEVVTNKAHEIATRVITELKRGVTILDSFGAYTETKNNLLICIVRKMEMSEFKKIVKEIDPNAFVYAINTVEVLGRGFASGG